MRFTAVFYFFHNLVKSDFLTSPTYREFRLTRTFANSDTFSIPLESPTYRDSTVSPTVIIPLYA